MPSRWSAFRRLGLVLAVLVAALTFGAGQAFAAQAAGDPTLVVPIDDSESGASYDQTFTLAYSGATPDGTPVYVYVPQGAFGGVAGVTSLDPQFDPDPTDEFVPCADNSRDDYVITQEQVTSLGNELASHIVAVDEAQYGEMGAPPGTSNDALVVFVYNIQDESYYDCAETTYTVGYFAPDYLKSLGMNVIVIDAYDWANRIGAQEGNEDGVPYLMEGVIAHELEHLLMEYSDSTEVSWVDEGLADLAIFLNGYPAGGSHVAYQQVFHRETSLTRWGGGLENYGASFTFFLYLWERAGGEGGGNYAPDGLNDGPGDRLIQAIFAEGADSLEGVQKAIDTYNATAAQPLPSVEELFQDWVVTMYLDAEGTKYDLHSFELGSEEASWGWTIDVANDLFWNGRGIYKGAMPEPRWTKGNVPAQVALPFGASYERFTNPGSSFSVSFSGQPSVDIVPLVGTGHWWGGAENNSDNVLDVTSPVTGGQTLAFDTWYFIEQGWDYGFVEALVNGEWVTLELVDANGETVTTNDDPHENNEEGNGLTGTSGGEYFVDQPEYIHLQTKEPLPAGTTAVRFRYSTDAGYLDAGWFVSNVTVGGAPATLASAPSPDEWTWVDGPEQDNNWSVQIIASCDITPGSTVGEIHEGSWYVYRLNGDEFAVAGFDTKCLKGREKGDLTVAISNLPTGALTVFDAPYVFRVTNTGNGANARS